MMVTVIHADRFETKDEPLDRLSNSGGPRLGEFTTEDVLKAMDKISARPEMRELDRLMMALEASGEPLDRLSDSGGPRLGELTTEDIIKAMDEISARPEMRELDRLMMEGPGYLHGCEAG